MILMIIPNNAKYILVDEFGHITLHPSLDQSRKVYIHVGQLVTPKEPKIVALPAVTDNIPRYLSTDFTIVTETSQLYKEMVLNRLITDDPS